MDDDNELTIAARVKDWEIFTPDWDYLRQHPTLELGSLCAMSVGLHPAFASLEWVFSVAIPHFDGSKRDLEDLIPPEEREAFFDSGLHDAHVNVYRSVLLDRFLRRVNIASANLTPLGLLPVALGEPDRERTLVGATAFSSWAEGMGWSLPSEFPRAEKYPEVAGGLTADGRWPWGNHETELLQKLAAAAEKFWKLYDPTDDASAPTNDQVIEWLKQQGVAERNAEIIATILRADGLRTGPRKTIRRA